LVLDALKPSVAGKENNPSSYDHAEDLATKFSEALSSKAAMTEHNDAANGESALIL